MADPQDVEAHVAAARAQQPSARVIHVSGESPVAADSNPGTETLPVRNISRAAELALSNNATGLPVTVLVHPGIYREAISLPPGGTSAPLIFQATEVGKAVVSGSDVWTDWTRWGDRGIYTHGWPYAWRLAPIPQGWPPLRDIVRRREMVFVNGELLAQVLSPDQVAAGTFYVDETAHVVYIWPGNGLDPNGALVEVAVRDALFIADHRSNVTIRGLVFEHAASALDASAVTVSSTTDFLIEDTTFRWNNWGGLVILASTNGSIHHSAANHNGARGMANWKNKNLRYDDVETSYNNWRGTWGGFGGWAAAGIKSMLLHGGTFRRHRSVGNLTYGFWLDTDNQDVSIDDGLWCNNAVGAFVEKSQGPVNITRTVICANTSAGMLVSLSERVRLQDSVLYRNGSRQQFEINNLVSGTEYNWETGQPIHLQTQSWTFCGNAFVGSPFLLSVPNWDFFRQSLRSTRNDYWNPGGTKTFWLRESRLIGRAIDLLGWQQVSGQDTGSVFADPRFADPAKRDFSRLPGSPWPKCSS